MAELSITVFFVGILALLHVPLTLMVGLRRAEIQVPFLDGGDQALLRRMRAHGNFTENVPMALIAMAAAEHMNAAGWMLWLGGFSLLLGRLLHAYVTLKQGFGLSRANAMLLTLAPIALFGGFSLWQGVKSLMG